MQIKKVRSVPTLPSGFSDESPEDRAATKEIIQAGKILDVEVMDHLIICGNSNRWISLKERGIEF